MKFFLALGAVAAAVAIATDVSGCREPEAAAAVVAVAGVLVVEAFVISLSVSCLFP